MCVPLVQTVKEPSGILLMSNGLTEKYGIRYGGLVELVVNAMVDTPKPFIEWE